MKTLRNWNLMDTNLVEFKCPGFFPQRFFPDFCENCSEIKENHEIEEEEDEVEE